MPAPGDAAGVPAVGVPAAGEPETVADGVGVHRVKVATGLETMGEACVGIAVADGATVLVVVAVGVLVSVGTAVLVAVAVFVAVGTDVLVGVGGSVAVGAGVSVAFTVTGGTTTTTGPEGVDDASARGVARLAGEAAGDAAIGEPGTGVAAEGVAIGDA